MADFKQIINRRNTNSEKWDVKPNELPMWVADMDFKTAPAIMKAMDQKIGGGAFGYEYIPDEYYAAVAQWYETEHNVRPKTEWMAFVNGVVPAISSIVRRESHPGDNVVVQSPVYNIFYNSIENNGRHVLSNDLIYNKSNHRYQIDFTDLEAKLADPLSTLMIFCNPHNPVGKVWSRDELMQIALLCQKHNVTMISDEIHGDLVFDEPAYTPIFALPEKSLSSVVALVSTSKTFNVAAMHSATAIIPNHHLRESILRGFNNDELTEPNILAVPGTIAAYTQGADWLHELKAQLNENRQRAMKFVDEEISGLKSASENATYLLWFDASDLSSDSQKLADFIRADSGLYLSSGTVYRGNGNNFLRLNVACPPDTLTDGLNRLKKSVQDFKTQAK